MLFDFLCNFMPQLSPPQLQVLSRASVGAAALSMHGNSWRPPRQFLQKQVSGTHCDSGYGCFYHWSDVWFKLISCFVDKMSHWYDQISLLMVTQESNSQWIDFISQKWEPVNFQWFYCFSRQLICLMMSQTSTRWAQWLNRQIFTLDKL